MARTWKLILIGLAASLGGCGDPATPKETEVRPVRTVVVDPKPIEDDRSAVGEVRPRYESDLGFRVSGKVISRLVDPGVSVRKGDLLARLDEQDYRNKLKSAEADVAAAEAVLVESQGTEDRLRQLLATGTTTRANYDAAIKNLRSAEAKLDSARAALALAKDQLRYSELRADFDGVVTAVGAEAGQVVNVGQMIVRLAQPKEKDAVFAIAESAFKTKPTNEHPEIIISLLSNPDITAEGVVREVSPVADPVTRTYQVKVTLQDPPEQIRFGASVLGRLKASTAPVVVLPGSALFEKDGKPAVWVVDKAKGTVGLKSVTIARYETDRIIVSDGVAKGDVVVTAGVNRLRENQAVRLAERAAK
ncbi:MAG TPA: efflux RND transporter periplasmic adaptor subunit [Hyphomicrobiaceae bacterium]|nr:efflux RND transporter periplasmic adaptor subunit [Hyphomicrobiaceae bacterium]